MKRWFILTAIGRDRPGIVSELAKLVFACDANLEDSRMTLLGSEFAVMLLCSSTREDAGANLDLGVKRLEREHGLVILLRHLESGPRPSASAHGFKLYRLQAAGEDKAGIVSGICGVLAENAINIADLSTRSVPGPGGSPHYEMIMEVEVPAQLDLDGLRGQLDEEANRLVVDLSIEPA